MGCRANTPPMGYDIPGSDRRFIAVYGSLNWPAVTCAPTTVVGTRTGSQPEVSTPGFDSAAPSASILAADAIRQPSSRGVRASAPAALTAPPSHKVNAQAARLRAAVMVISLGAEPTVTPLSLQPFVKGSNLVPWQTGTGMAEGRR